VRAKAPYPSDVLASMALGHFLEAFINDAFLSANSPRNFLFSVEPSREDVYCILNWFF
jgi:hypothetical protein